MAGDGLCVSDYAWKIRKGKTFFFFFFDVLGFQIFLSHNIKYIWKRRLDSENGLFVLAYLLGLLIAFI